MNPEFQRIFIVGCPRSGTTLLQSMMAAHPKLTSYPETHFWDYTIPDRLRYRFPKIYTSREKQVVRDYLSEHQFSLEAMSGMKPFYLTTRGWSKALMRVLDHLTETNFSGWIEKTPRHLYAIPHIIAADADALFLHILREGKDVVASMYEVTQNYPEHWSGARDLDTCISRWKKDIKLSKAYLDDDRHSFVCYDDLVHSKQKMIQNICGFLALDFAPEMVREFTDEAQDLVGTEEKWKSANIKGKKTGDKFSRVFTEEEQEYVIQQIKDISLDPFRGQIKKPVANDNVKNGDKTG